MDKNNKKLSLIYSAIMIALAVIFTFFAMMPTIRLDTEDLYISSSDGGRYTSKVGEITEVKLGFSTAVTLIFNAKDISDIISIEKLDSSIAKKQEELNELIDDGNDRESKQIERLEDDIAELNEELEDKLFDITTEDEERFEKLLNNENIRNAIGSLRYLGQSVVGMFSIGEIPYGTNYAPILSGGFGITVLIMLIGAAIIFPLVMLIIVIIKIIKLIIAIKKGDEEAMEKNSAKFPFMIYSTTIFLLCVFYSIFASGVSLGIGVIGALVIWIIANIFSAVKTIIYDKNNRVASVVKKSITLVSIISLAVLAVCFTEIGLMSQYTSVSDDISIAKTASAMSSGLSENALDEAVTNANLKTTLILLFASFLAIAFIASALISVIERIGDKTQKVRGELKPYKAMPVLAILVLAFSVMPMIFSAASIEEREEAYSKGNFKIYYSAYEESGSNEYAEYEEDKLKYEELTELRTSLEKQIKQSDEEEKQELKKQLKIVKRMEANTAKNIKNIETQGTKAIVCIVMAAIFLASEIGLIVAGRVLPEKKQEE